MLVSLLLFFFSVQHAALAREHNATSTRPAKFLSMFEIVTFQNSGCQAGSSGRNGTCYTANECTSLGGSNSGTCAAGFGVCCVFNLNCGAMSSQNCTYLSQNGVMSLNTNPCTYTICSSSPDICRIRFDFNTFSIADPEAGTTALTGAAAPGTGLPIGDCRTDTFSISSPGNVGTPIICGTNTGQHVFVDTSGSTCHTVAISLGSSSTNTRSWDIKVTQHNCGATEAGPDGCLQYHTGASGTVQSFNFPMSTVTAAATHLSNQCYSICFRRESGSCAICFVPSIVIAVAIAMPDMQNSFGISNSIAADTSDVDSECNSDYIIIPDAVDVTPASPLTIGTFAAGDVTAGRICGRVFTASNGVTAAIAYTISSISVCTQVTPFRIGVKFDSDELTTGTDATNNEQVSVGATSAAGGITGFSLNYRQINC